MNNDNHLLDIIRKIYEMQERIENHENNINNCTRPILGPNEVLNNTRPFVLYLCNNTPLEIQYESDEGTLTSSIFRVENINDSCVTVRLLAETDGEITATNETATINMDCIAAIRCLRDINLGL